MVKYADLMGTLEAIKITTNLLQEELDDKFSVFSKTIKYLESNIRELSKQIASINQDNISDFSKKLESILKIEKTELNQPLIKYQKNILLEEKKLSKISETIVKLNEHFKAVSTKDPKIKPQLTSENNSQLAAMILVLSKTINEQKQMVENLLNNLNVIKEQATALNEKIKPFYYSQEQDNLIKHLSDFNKKFPTLMFSVPEAKVKLSEQVEMLQKRIAPLAITSTPTFSPTSTIYDGADVCSSSTAESAGGSVVTNSPKNSPRL